ncbi:MAG: hypothetical protein IPN83_22070 [Holophagales bacterium]|jgi:hypothetical protein|nr:hypothetical protein [Holophagales bacterium]
MKRTSILVAILTLGVTWGRTLRAGEIPLGTWNAPPTWAAAGAASGASDSSRMSAAARADSIDALDAVPTPPLVFTGIAPCRVADTRDSGFPPGYGPPSMPSSAPRDFTLAGRCDIPSSAQAVSVNFTVTNTLGAGFLLVFPAGGAAASVSTLNYLAGQTVANAAVVPLGTGGALTAVAGVSGFDLLVDVNGYYAPSTGGSRTLLVGPVGTAAQNGAALLAALAGITTASATNPWLVKVEPGVYDVGTTPLTMKPYVDLEGSGEGVTRLLGSTSAGSPSTGTVVGSSNAELRFLTVESAGANVHAAIFCSGSFRLTHVTAAATGGSFPIAVYNSGGSSVLTAVTISSSGGYAYGFYNVFGSPTLVDARVTSGQTAVFNDRGNVTIRGSVLSGGSTGLFASTDAGSPGSFLSTVEGSKVFGGSNSISAASASGSTMTVLVGTSQLAGGPVTGSGTVRCVGVYDASFNSPGYTTCP